MATPWPSNRLSPMPPDIPRHWYLREGPVSDQKLGVSHLHGWTLPVSEYEEVKGEVWGNSASAVGPEKAGLRDGLHHGLVPSPVHALSLIHI